ncbi:MAG TPA: FAD-dependent oxidoreductase, partial [Polaromonas sp.]
ARALRNGQIFHAEGLLRWGRDASLKLLGQKLLDLPWLYGATPKVS